MLYHGNDSPTERHNIESAQSLSYTTRTIFRIISSYIIPNHPIP